MASKKSTTHVKILGSLTQHITNGAWHAQPYIPDRILCTLQRTQMGMGSWTQSGCMWDECVQHIGNWPPHHSRQSSTGFMSHSLLSWVYSKSLFHLTKIHQIRTVLKSRLSTPGTRVPWIVKSLATLSTALLQLIPTWAGIQAKILTKTCLALYILSLLK